MLRDLYLKRLALMLLALSLSSSTAGIAAEWNNWRGPFGDGLSDSSIKNLPVKWTSTENVKWKKKLPAPGNSTPVIWKDRIFVSGVGEKKDLRTLMCFNREDGELLWTQGTTYDKPEKTHDTNPYCSASPTTDGKRVVVWHGSAGVFAYDLDGKPLWNVNLGEFDHIWGNGSSPLLHGDLVIINAGPGMRAFVVALNADTGKEVWRYEPKESISENVGEFRGSWSTPVVAKIDGRDELLLSLPLQLVSLDPLKGTVLWKCEGLSKLSYTSPLVGKDFIVAMSGYHGPAIGVKAGDKPTGDITTTHRLWRKDQKIPQRVGSGVIVGDYIYILNEPGIAWCIDAKTGETKWEKRITSTSWSSMVLADGKIFVANMNGGTVILDPDPTECKVVGTNDLKETMRASVAVAPGQIFLRTYGHLYCIETKK